VNLGTVHVVLTSLADPSDPLGIVLGGRKVVAQLAVFDHGVADVDSKPGDAAVEPEPQDVVERVSNALVPPVQIGLVPQKVVKVVLTARLVELPCRLAAEDADPVVRR
jgi:hypothetical protein